MRRVIGLAIIAFTVTLGIVVGNRLSSEAMAVVVGIVCGVLASVPTSVLLLVAARRLTADSQQRRSQQHQGTYPPVIVISPNAGQSGQQPSYPLFGPPDSAPASYGPRDFRIVGEEDEEDWEDF